MLSPPEPPRSVCILRLSAIGDACHVVPIVRTLQQAWPTAQLTWIIGRSEARLMRLLDGVEFITVDKRTSLAGLASLRRLLAARHFEVLLHMQLALRASLVAACVPARVKLGFDRARARELQWLFTNARIAPHTREHVLDSFFGFPAALGIGERLLRWDLRLPAEAQTYAARLVPDRQPTLVISPCSSHPLRNWRAARYATVAESAVRRHGMRVILAGGPSESEQRMGVDIERACQVPLTNQIGKDTLPELLALLARARTAHPRLRTRTHGDHGGHAGRGSVCRYQPGAQRAVPLPALVRRCVCGSCAHLPRLRTRPAALDAQDRGAGSHGPHRGRSGHRKAR
jgi:heptosyltransferase I